jgi:DNA-binding MarR family transcriptional regulator
MPCAGIRNGSKPGTASVPSNSGRLWELAQTPGLRAVDLAKAMAMPRPNTESLLDGLLKRGLVMESPTRNRPRPALYFVTFDGQRIADASPQFGQGVLKAAMNNLPDDSLLNLARP